MAVRVDMLMVRFGIKNKEMEWLENFWCARGESAWSLLRYTQNRSGSCDLSTHNSPLIGGEETTGPKDEVRLTAEFVLDICAERSDDWISLHGYQGPHKADLIILQAISSTTYRM